MQDFKIKKRMPNIFFGLLFGLLAIKLSCSFWSYIFYIISALLFVYADQIIKIFSLEFREKIKIKDSIDIVSKDKDGNIKNKYSSK